MDNNTIDFNTINFNTGDIILFQDTKRNTLLDWLGYFIQYFTKSKYSHVGMVVKDPLIKGKTITGIYLLESTAFDAINAFKRTTKMRKNKRRIIFFRINRV